MKENMKDNMKALMQKVGYSLAIAICELALGILLLLSPEGLTSSIFVILAILLIALGVAGIINYVRLPREDSAKTWKLSSGAAGICVGISAIINRAWLVETFVVLTGIYGAVVIAIAFLKLQMAVDALRGSRKFWFLMAISCVLSIVVATLMFVNPFASAKAAWIFMGVSLIIVSALDIVYFVLGRQERK